MRSLRLLILAVVASVLAGCPPTGTPPKHIHTNRPDWNRHEHEHPSPKKIGTGPGTYCADLACNKVVYIDATCGLKDATGAEITAIDASVGTRICFFNNSGCSLTLKFDDEVFGQSRAVVTLGSGECVNLAVNAEAANSNWLFEVICTCVEGGGHGNPEIKVGGGTGGGG